MSSLSANELSNLDNDSKKSMLTFIDAENSKQKIQMSIHQFTNSCFKKCVSSVESGNLSSTEEQCLANCVNRFLDANIRIINGLQNSQNSP